MIVSDLSFEAWAAAAVGARTRQVKAIVKSTVRNEKFEKAPLDLERRFLSWWRARILFSISMVSILANALLFFECYYS
jgi:predicted CDP-diglyceride synthetase/phosphatidate cytidylyltransferase